MKLWPYQLKAMDQLRVGNVLCGDTGSGKSITALSWYYIWNGGSRDFLSGGEYKYMTGADGSGQPADLYIITTALKRDTLEWEKDMIPFLIGRTAMTYNHKVVVDSWQNLHKYTDIKNSFVIFDEQRVVGKGQWVKSFLKITKNENRNNWILLSATPGDNWGDYVPLFIANGFYRNRKEFSMEHEVYARHCNFPKIEKYLNTKKLEKLRSMILVDMDFVRKTEAHHCYYNPRYDGDAYKNIHKTRMNPWTNEPIRNAAELCYCLRRLVNSDPTRSGLVRGLSSKHPRMIIFYNFDYELDILRAIQYPSDTVIAEWNGHKHEPVPDSERWVYLVQYTAGSEGWNCVTTDTMVFFSQNYSYKVMHQAEGRIDRANTPFTDLYYYHMKSSAAIDRAISRALTEKRTFNERRFAHW